MKAAQKSSSLIANTRPEVPAKPEVPDTARHGLIVARSDIYSTRATGTCVYLWCGSHLITGQPFSQIPNRCYRAPLPRPAIRNLKFVRTSKSIGAGAPSRITVDYPTRLNILNTPMVTLSPGARVASSHAFS